MKVSDFPIDPNVTINDYLLGSDAEDTNKTKNYPINSILSLFVANLPPSATGQQFFESGTNTTLSGSGTQGDPYSYSVANIPEATVITGGTDISVSGIGTTQNPYIINNTAVPAGSTADQNRIIGRITAGNGPVETLTPTQVRTILEVETTTQLIARDNANRSRSSHTGTQLASTISNFQAAVEALSSYNNDVWDALPDDDIGGVSFTGGNLILTKNDGSNFSQSLDGRYMTGLTAGAGITLTGNPLSPTITFSGSLTESDPVFLASQAANITAQNITDLGNLSGTNTGDQDTSGINATTPVNANTVLQTILEDHEARIQGLAAGGADGVVSNVALSGTDLVFTGSGGGFNGTVSLATLGGGAGTWGSITGTLSNQTDLQTALDARVDDSTNQSSLGGDKGWTGEHTFFNTTTNFRGKVHIDTSDPALALHANSGQSNTYLLTASLLYADANGDLSFNPLNGLTNNKLGFTFVSSNASTRRNYALPDADGTLALASDIPAALQPDTANSITAITSILSGNNNHGIVLNPTNNTVVVSGQFAFISVGDEVTFGNYNAATIRTNNNNQSLVTKQYVDEEVAGAAGADGVISNVALSGTDLNFTGSGGGFNGTVSLATLSGNSWSDAVDSDIVPDATGTRTIGASLNRFLNGYFDTITADFVNSSIEINTESVFLADNPSLTGSATRGSIGYVNGDLFRIKKPTNNGTEHLDLNINALTANRSLVFSNTDITYNGTSLLSGGGGASQLIDLSDVNTSTPTNRHVLIADGVDFESRLLVENDISDLGSYLPTSGGQVAGRITLPYASGELRFVTQTSSNWDMYGGILGRFYITDGTNTYVLNNGAPSDSDHIVTKGYADGTYAVAGSGLSADQQNRLLNENKTIEVLKTVDETLSTEAIEISSGTNIGKKPFITPNSAATTRVMTLGNIGDNGDTINFSGNSLVADAVLQVSPDTGISFLNLPSGNAFTVTNGELAVARKISTTQWRIDGSFTPTSTASTNIFTAVSQTNPDSPSSATILDANTNGTEEFMNESETYFGVSHQADVPSGATTTNSVEYARNETTSGQERRLQIDDFDTHITGFSAGTTYNFSLWIKHILNSGTQAVRISFVNSDVLTSTVGTVSGEHISLTLTDSTWTQVTGTFSGNGTTMELEIDGAFGVVADYQVRVAEITVTE